MEKSTLDQLKIERRPENERGGGAKFAVIIVVVLALAVVAAWLTWFRAEPAIEIETTSVRQVSGSSVSTVLNASGYVTARRAATVSSKFTGRVKEVLIEEGMQVETGDILARLDDSNIRASFNLAEAQLESARRGLEETRSLLREAELNYERSKSLTEKQLGSVAELDRSRALASSLTAQLQRKRADVEVAERQVDIYRLQLEDMIIRAPFAGVIVAKNAQPGEMISPVSAGGGFTRTGIGTIVDMSSLEIEIDVNEAYINRVEPGQEVVATLDAYPDWKIPSHVIAIIPTADRQRATVEVRVGFDELDARILPDMGVKVAFQQVAANDAVPQSGLLVPQGAIARQDGRDYVFVVSGGLAERRAIAAVETRGEDVLVSGGLSAAEIVVIDPPPGLVDGARVTERK